MTYTLSIKWGASLSLSTDLKGLGTFFQTKNSIIFFGNRYFHPRILKNYYSIHQVHGNKVIPANKQQCIADGHHTNKKNIALGIQTADCMPVMIECDDQIFALHIGWRSLAQKILTEAVKDIKNPQNARMWIGPHIHQQNFRLDENSVLQILKPHNLSKKQAYKENILQDCYEQKNHYLVNLNKILCKEAKSLGVINIESSDRNTYSNPDYNSHRRNRFSKKRNYSFILSL